MVVRAFFGKIREIRENSYLRSEGRGLIMDSDDKAIFDPIF